MEEQLTTLQKIIDMVLQYMVAYSFQILAAILILIAGFMLGGWCSRGVFALCQTKKFDITLSKFIASIVRGLVIAFAVLVALGKFGITIAPFVAAVGALAFGASFAIQGPLSNYGAGLSIILSRPFVVGDTLKVADQSGVVQEVKLACTILTNEDGTRITIPNNAIVGQILHNSKGSAGVESVIGISYGSDPEKAIQIVRDVLAANASVAKDPEPQVGIQEFADSSVNIGYRYWVPTVQYFATSYAVNLALYKAFRDKGIEIPFPQREVRMLTETANK